jgi:hypothetical protein
MVEPTHHRRRSDPEQQERKRRCQRPAGDESNGQSNRQCRDHQKLPQGDTAMAMRTAGIGGLPFKEMPARHGGPVKGAYDRIAGEPCLMGEERNFDGCPDNLVCRSLPAFDGTNKSKRPAFDQRHQGRQHDGERRHQRPDERGGREHPRTDQEKYGGNGDQAAAEIVENPSAIQGAQRIRLPSRWTGNAEENPRGDLPVAADPAMLAFGEAAVAVGNGFEQLDVAGMADACVRAFDQVVAQQGFRRKAIPESRMECAYIVDGFSVEDRF